MATATEQMVSVRVPSEDDFDGADFLADEVLDMNCWDVVREYERLHVITDHDITLTAVWKRKGGKSHGSAVLAKCVKTSGLARFFGEYQFVIWLAADHLDAEQFTPEQLRRLLYHEARHIGWEEPNDINEDGEGKPVLVGHTIELFDGEISDTGLWESFRRRLGREFSQPTLFGASEA
jgi:hypothetical protein